MKPVDQTIVSSLDGKVRGNCLPACLASLFEMHILSVPAFQDMGRGAAWYFPFMDFIEGQGASLRGTFYFGDGRSWPELRALNPGMDGLYICAGTSPRAHVTDGHAVIYNGDGQMVHDPHPSKAGLLEVKSAYLICPAGWERPR